MMFIDWADQIAFEIWAFGYSPVFYTIQTMHSWNSHHGDLYFINRHEDCENSIKKMYELYKKHKGQIMHKKIMEKASKALKKDAAHYSKEAKHAKTPAKKKEEKVERKEALSAAKDLKKRAKKAHEY